MRSRMRLWGAWAVVLTWAAVTHAAPAGVPAQTAGQAQASPQAGLSNPDVETEIGRAAGRDLERRYGLYADAAANARVNRLAAQMVRASGCPSPFQFRVLNADEPNGVSLPGGFIYVTRGLLRLLPEDDLLTAALGHEVGHIALGHMTELLRQGQGDAPRPRTNPAAEAARPDGKGAAPSPDPFTPLPDEKPRESPTHAREKQADRAAARYLRAAGADPRAMILLLHRLSKQPELNADASSTHPTWPDRIKCLEAYLRSAEFTSLPRAGGLPSLTAPVGATVLPSP